MRTAIAFILGFVAGVATLFGVEVWIANHYDFASLTSTPAIERSQPRPPHYCLCTRYTLYCACEDCRCCDRSDARTPSAEVSTKLAIASAETLQREGE